MAWCLRASLYVPHTDGEITQEHLTVSAPPARLRWGTDDGSRWWCPVSSMAMTPSIRMGPPPRSFRCRCALRHHGLGLWPTEYKDVARMFAHHRRAPPRLRHPDTYKCAVVLAAVKDEPTVALRAILEPLLRAPTPRSYWAGMKKRLPVRTKKRRIRKWIGPARAPLTKITPYKDENAAGGVTE